MLLVVKKTALNKLHNDKIKNVFLTQCNIIENKLIVSGYSSTYRLNFLLHFHSLYIFSRNFTNSSISILVDDTRHYLLYFLDNRMSVKHIWSRYTFIELFF